MDRPVECDLDLDAMVVGNVKMTVNNIDPESMEDLVNMVMKYDPEILKVLDTPPVASSETGEDLSMQTDTDIIRSEDTVEELPENLPSIRNLKSRFEGGDSPQVSQHVTVSHSTYSAPPAVNGYDEEGQEAYHDDVISRDPDIVRETNDKEEVHFAEMSSVRNKFETIAHSSPVVPSPTSSSSLASKRTSKWDKPKPTQQHVEVVNRRRDSDDEETSQTRELEIESELPPAGLSRNLAARYQQSTQNTSESEYRKPVRKMTPPRDVLEDQINEVHDVILENAPTPSQTLKTEPAERDPDVIVSDMVSIREEELPTPAFTKSMLQKFRNLEQSTGAAPPSPTKSTPKSTKTTTKTTTIKSTTSSKVSSKPKAEVTQTKVSTTRRASPDSGIADSEMEAAQRTEYDAQTRDDVIRESTPAGEEEMPQRGLARNLLQQWRSIEFETTPLTEAPKQVKMKRHHTVTTDNRQQSAQRTSQTKEPERQRKMSEPVNQEAQQSLPMFEDEELGGRAVAENEPMRRDDVIREADANENEYLPPPKFTKNLLAKFQTLEVESSKQTPPKSPTKKKKVPTATLR